MKKLKMLVLTDHRGHTNQNSLYTLVHAMRQHPRCAQLDVASRGNAINDAFFKEFLVEGLYVSEVDEHFAFYTDGRSFQKNLRRELLRDYDVVWLRLPPPLTSEFLNFLSAEYPDQLFINHPKGIEVTGSKEFLLNFPDLCPPMKLCTSLEDIISLKKRFPIVLKPLKEYGGRGILKIDGEQVWLGTQQMHFDTFTEIWNKQKVEYLGVQFLKNVSQGDKRIVVIDGRIMGASLRLPPKGSWICNVAMGGNSNLTGVDEDEKKIVERIHPLLSRWGIVMYGVDTLVGDDGRRRLSEINTTSIGGLPQIAKMTGKPLLKRAADLIWNHITEKKQEKDVFSN